MFESYLGDTLAVLAAVEDGPCDAAGVLALEEKRLGLAVLETEDLAVATDVELALNVENPSVLSSCGIDDPSAIPFPIIHSRLPPFSSLFAAKVHVSKRICRGEKIGRSRTFPG